MNAGISVVCYKSKILKNGESPLMLRICKDGKKNYQSLGNDNNNNFTLLWEQGVPGSNPGIPTMKIS